MFDFNVALQLLLPLETPATGHTRIHEAPKPDSHVTRQVQVCARAAAIVYKLAVLSVLVY